MYVGELNFVTLGKHLGTKIYVEYEYIISSKQYIWLQIMPWKCLSTPSVKRFLDKIHVLSLVTYISKID